MPSGIRLGDVVVKRGSTSGGSSSPTTPSTPTASSGYHGMSLSDAKKALDYASSTTAKYKPKTKKKIVKNKQYIVVIKEKIKIPGRKEPLELNREYKTMAKTKDGAIANVRGVGVTGRIISVELAE